MIYEKKFKRYQFNFKNRKCEKPNEFFGNFSRLTEVRYVNLKKN